ncbi:MAG: hypothetical protein R6V57_03435 [Vicinamibacterales bacterium]
MRQVWAGLRPGWAMAFEGFTLHARVEDSIEVVGGPLLETRDPDGDP